MKKGMLKRFISCITACSIVLSVTAMENVSAAEPNRTPVLPTGAPENAILIEGENGQLSNAFIGDDHNYSGTGFTVLNAEVDQSKVTYEVDVEKAGPYYFAFNYVAGKAAPGEPMLDDRSINIYVNEELDSKETFVGTDDWDTWNYHTKALFLEEGTNTVVLETAGKYNGICLDYFYYWYGAQKVEMESTDELVLNDAFTADDHNPSGGEHVVINDASPNSSVQFKLTVLEKGDYAFDFCYIAGDKGQTGKKDPRQIIIAVNESELPIQEFESDSSWDKWMNKTVVLPLEKGENTITIGSNGTTGNGICIDYFTYEMVKTERVLKEIRFQNLNQDGTLPDLAIDETIKFPIELIYDNGVVETTVDEVEYQSSNNNIIKVNYAGELQGVSEGTAQVTAKYSEMSVTATVNVYEPDIPVNATVYEAEEANLSGGTKVVSDHSGYTGNGFVAGFDFNGSGKLTFNIEVQTKGEFKVAVRYSAGAEYGWPDERTLGIQINDQNQPNAVFSSTNDWDTWNELVLTANLEEGNNTITILNLTNNDNSDCINVDHLSIWKEIDNPELSKVFFEKESYIINEGECIYPKVMGLYTDECIRDLTENFTFTTPDDLIITIDGNSVIAKQTGKAVLMATNGSMETKTEINVGMIATIDFGNEIKPYDPSMFGYILTPNYDIADSRVRLLGPVLNRDSIPAQNFQAISDGNPEYYDYEDSILQRAYEGYTRSQDLGTQFYFLLGHLPSWVKGGEGGIDWGGIPYGPWSGTPDNLDWFKQYIKDVLQYFKDRGAEFKFADLINENWTGWDDTYIALWEALREVYPEEIPAVGPGEINFTDRPDLMIPNLSDNNVTLEGPSWHGYWGEKVTIPLSVMQSWYEQVKALQEEYPETNGKYIIFEENNSNVDDQSVWARDMINTIRSGITHSVKGCFDQDGWNGMSNLLVADKSRQNTGYRTEQWWLYYAYSLMSGTVVNSHTVDEENGFTAVGYKDTEESKVMVTTPFVTGEYSLKINLENQPYEGKDIIVDAYKIVDVENDGLQYQKSFEFENSDKDVKVNLEDLNENETWMLIIKEKQSAPSFVHPKSPDDGEVALSKPTLTWSESQGADSYKVIVSENEDMSDPIISKDEIEGTEYTLEETLENGKRYYWTVVAHNEYGDTTVIHDVAYSFLVGESTEVPGQFGPYMPSMYAPNESVTPEFKWSTAYNATSYRLVVSKNSDMSNPVIDQSGITDVRWTEQFGDNTQAYYTSKIPLEYDTTYYWKVYASNEHGERPMNGSVHVFTTKAEGNSPTSFALEGPDNNATNVDQRVVLDWEESKNAFFYDLRISKNQDMSDPVLVRDRMIYNRYTMEPNLLEPDTTYYWTVTAYTKDLEYSTETESGVKSFTTKATASSPLLYAQNVDGNDVTLWFQASHEASSYKILYGTESGKYTEEVLNVTESPYVVEDLGKGTYYFAVVASNDEGDSAIWNEREVTVTQENSTEIRYTAIVENGTGNGDYKEGATVTIKAQEAPEGKVFDKWVSEDGVIFADANAEETTFNMPAKSVTVTATYKDKADDKYTYTVTLPFTQEGITIGVVSGDPKSVPYDGTVQFTVTKNFGYTKSNIVVKTNGQLLTPNASGIYTINNIRQNQNVTVDGVRLNVYTVTYPVIEGLTIKEVWPCNPNAVTHGTDFKFKTNLHKGYKGSRIAVKVGSTTLYPDANGIYTITDVNDYKSITVTGVRKDVEIVMDDETLRAGDSTHVEVLNVPAGSSLKLHIGNPRIAVLDRDGNLYCRKGGTAKLIATTYEYGKRVVTTKKIKIKKTSHSFRKSDGTYKVGKLYYEIIMSPRGSRGGLVRVATNQNAALIGKKVTIPNKVKIKGKTYKVTEIGAGAFSRMKQIKEVNIPRYVRTVSSSAFLGCKNLTKFKIHKKNQYFRTIKGGACLVYKKTILAYPSASGKFVAPRGIYTIGEYAFMQTNVTKVVLHKNVKKVGSYAFAYCNKLKKITFKNKRAGSLCCSCVVDGVNYKCVAYVPKKSFKEYKKIFNDGQISKRIKVRKI